MTPPSRSKDKEYEELYYHVIKEADPHMALNQVIMRDKKTYDFYKDGLHTISQWIDKEMLRRKKSSQTVTADRLHNYAAQKE